MRRILRGQVLVLFALSFSALTVGPGSAADLRIKQLRSLLHRGQIKTALDEATHSLSATPGDPELECLLGDIRYRQADFDAAEEAYAIAARNSPNQACGFWGMGRLRSLQFDRDGARFYFAKAYRLEPNDLDVIWSYAGVATDAETHRRLLQRFVNIAMESQETARAEASRVSEALARLQLTDRVGIHTLGLLESTAGKYQIPLERYFGAGSAPVGVLVSARIGQSRPLRLLLDTGGSGILVNGRALRNVKLESVLQANVEGLGSGPVKKADLALAPMVEIGALRFRDVPVQVVSPSVIPDADGVIGADLFQDFLLTLDVRSLTMTLASLTAPAAEIRARSSLPTNEMDCENCGRTLSVFALSHYLLVRATVNGAKPGFFLLDTGSAHSVIGNLPAHHPDATAGSNVVLRGAQGFLSGASRMQPVSVRMGGGEWYDPTPISADLREMSQRHGVEISGTIGYSLLSQLVLTINYRDGLIRLAQK